MDKRHYYHTTDDDISVNSEFTRKCTAFTGLVPFSLSLLGGGILLDSLNTKSAFGLKAGRGLRFLSGLAALIGGCAGIQGLHSIFVKHSNKKYNEFAPQYEEFCKVLENEYGQFWKHVAEHGHKLGNCQKGA